MTYDPNANPWFRRTKLLSGLAFVALGIGLLAIDTTGFATAGFLLGGMLALLGLALIAEVHTATSTPGDADVDGGDST